MTFETICLNVRTRQREIRVVVVKRRLAPFGSTVTECAIMRETLLHVIRILSTFEVCLVTREALRGRSFKDSAYVAL